MKAPSLSSHAEAHRRSHQYRVTARQPACVNRGAIRSACKIPALNDRHGHEPASAGSCIHATTNASSCAVPRSQGAQKCHDIGHAAALSGRAQGIAEHGGEVVVAVEGLGNAGGAQDGGEVVVAVDGLGKAAEAQGDAEAVVAVDGGSSAGPAADNEGEVLVAELRSG
jgi:hypothetical protein